MAASEQSAEHELALQVEGLRVSYGPPTVGKPPAREDPGRFLTGYFAGRKDALGSLMQ